MTKRTKTVSPVIDPTQDIEIIHRLIGAAAVDNIGITGMMDHKGIIASATGSLIFLISEARKIDRSLSRSEGALYEALKTEAEDAIERVLSESRAKWAEVGRRSAGTRRGILATEG